MENDKQPVSRKNFLSWSVAITAILAIPAFLRPAKKTKQTKTVKMLTQDGRLVAIDVCNIPQKRERIESGDIHTWISKRKKSSL